MNRLPTALLLAPALIVTVGLTGGAVVLGFVRSFGVQPFGVSTPTTEAWAAVAALPGLLASVGMTLWVASVATVLSGLFGVAAALGLRTALDGVHLRRLAAVLIQLNLAVPHVVIAVGTLFLLAQSGLAARTAFAVGLIGRPADFPALVADPLGFGVIVGYAIKEAPFVATVVLVQLAILGGKPAAVARSLGANRRQVIRLVLLPMIAPGLVAELAVVFAFALGAYEMPAVLGASRPKLLPVLTYELFTSKDLADRPVAIALSLMTAAFAFATIAGLRLLLRAPGHAR